MTFQPSTYQQAVFDWIEHGTGDGIVVAVAGSGKTTTLVQAAQRLKVDNSIFLAFNKHIAEELAERLAGTGTVAKTFHSIGNQVLARHLGRAKLDDRKHKNLVKKHFESHRLPKDKQSDIIASTNKLVDLARVTLTDLGDLGALERLCLHHGFDIFDEAISAVPKIIRRGIDNAERYKEIDFTDMIYLPLQWNLQPPQVSFLFVDECQDLNAMQLELALRMRAPSGRMLFVGDASQAIYGFAGASADSFWRIKEITGATELPLSICYRCPSSHLDLARSIVPQIEARPDAPQGEIINAEEEKLPELVKEGDLILCRLTAPLVTWCIKLIQKRVAARVRGRDIGRDLCSILTKLEASIVPFDYRELPRYLNEYQAQQLDFLYKKDADESQVQSLLDRIECLQVCYSNFTNARSVAELADEINGLFSDERSSVWLSTVHKAKGLENGRVFILKPDKLPLVWENQRAWQFEQEMNLAYVALTRAKETLIVLGKLNSAIQPTPLKPRNAAYETGDFPDTDWGSEPARVTFCEPRPDYLEEAYSVPYPQPFRATGNLTADLAAFNGGALKVIRVKTPDYKERMLDLIEQLSDRELELFGDIIATALAARRQGVRQ